MRTFQAAMFSELGQRNVVERLRNDYELLQRLYASGLITEKCSGPDDCDL
jgi:hypothetical protein